MVFWYTKGFVHRLFQCVLIQVENGSCCSTVQDARGFNTDDPANYQPISKIYPNLGKAAANRTAVERLAVTQLPQV